jgi:hypothetical protein
MILMTVTALSLTTAAHAQQTRYYAPNGSSLGTSSTHGNVTDFYSAGGNRTGSASTDSQGNVTLRDAGGNVVGKSSTPHR